MSVIRRDPEAFANDAAPYRRPRVKQEAFLDFLRGLPCAVSGGPAEAAHLRMASPRHGKPQTGAGRRPDDRWAVPLSPHWHRLSEESQHAFGSETVFWQRRSIDPFYVAALLHSHWTAGDEHAARIVCRQAAMGAFPWLPWSPK